VALCLWFGDNIVILSMVKTSTPIILTITAFIRITERKTSTVYTRFIVGNPCGGENPTKLLQYRFSNKYNVSLKRDLTKTEDLPETLTRTE
jgi:hypothetical protein